MQHKSEKSVYLFEAALVTSWFPFTHTMLHISSIFFELAIVLQDQLQLKARSDYSNSDVTSDECSELRLFVKKILFLMQFTVVV